MSLTKITKRLLNLFTTKGDLLTFDGTSNLILSAGTDNFRLTADSTKPGGLKWSNILAAKGSLLVGDGTANDNHLNVGSDNQILIADSTQTVGLRWGSVASVLAGTALYEEFGTVDQGDIMGASAITENTFTKSSGTVIGYTFPANSLVAGGLYRLTAGGPLAIGASTTLTLRAYFGNKGTLLFTSGAISVGTSAAGWHISILLRVITTGSSGTARVTGESQDYQTATQPIGGFGSTLPTINTTTAEQFTLSQQFANSNAGNQIRMNQYVLERLV